MWQLVTTIDAVNIPKRPVALFGSYGWSGEGFAHVAGLLTAMKANVFEEHYKINFVPSEAELAAAEDLAGALRKALLCKQASRCGA